MMLASTHNRYMWNSAGYEYVTGHIENKLYEKHQINTSVNLNCRCGCI